MTLLHHAAFDGNIEALTLMSSLPYFKEIVDDSSNDVSLSNIIRNFLKI